MITTISININLDSKVTIQQSYFCISQWWTFERFWRRDVYWHDPDWPCWYKSYLSEHYYTAEVANWISKFRNILCGVQQGSILDPLLFLICVNNMNQAVKCDLYLYADNSCFIFQHKEVTETKKKLTKDFSNICDWFVDFVDNELIIHFGESIWNQFYLVLDIIQN